MKNNKTDINIIDQFELGLSSVSSLNDYKKILQEFPDEPKLHRLMANFLNSQRAYIEASKAYRKAYHLFMQQGMSLQAIAALMCTWDIVRPSPYELRSLHSRLKRKDSHTSAVAECFAKMSYPELIEVLSLVSLDSVEAGQVIQRESAPNNNLHLIVSGELTESLSKDDRDNADSKLLVANDYFGNLLPHDEKNSICSTFVKAETKTELLKISKKDLLSVCDKYPDFVTGLRNLQESKSLPDQEKPAKFFRKSSRQELSIILNLEIFSHNPGLSPINLKGYTSDISLGGSCVIVDPKYKDIPDKLAGRNAKIKISLPDETVSLTIMGRLAWSKSTRIGKAQTTAIGIQFNEMPPKVRGLLIVFAHAVGTMTKLLEEGGFSQDSIETRTS